MLFLLLSVGILITNTGRTALAKTNTTETTLIQPYLEPKNTSLPEEDLVLMQDNSLVGVYSPVPREIYRGNRALLSEFDWNIDYAYKVMICESEGNPTKINWKDNHKVCKGSFGLFQLSCDKGTKEELLDPETNVKIAYEVWQKNGWKKDWVNCSK